MQKTLLIVALLILLVACTEPEPTPTSTPSPTSTPIATPTPTLVPTPTLTPTPLPTATFTPTPSPTPTPTPTPLPTATFTPTATATHTPTPTFTPTPSPTPTPTFTPTPIPTWPVSETLGDWYVNDRGIDPLSELHGVSLRLSSTNERYRLVIRCNVDPRNPNHPEVLINWENEIEEQEPEVTWRLDDGRIMIVRWYRSSTEVATFYQGDVKRFIWRLMNSDELSARIITDLILTATFELEGLAEALRPYKDSCDWVGF